MWRLLTTSSRLGSVRANGVGGARCATGVTRGPPTQPRTGPDVTVRLRSLPRPGSGRARGSRRRTERVGWAGQTPRNAVYRGNTPGLAAPSGHGYPTGVAGRCGLMWERNSPLHLALFSENGPPVQPRRDTGIWGGETDGKCDYCIGFNLIWTILSVGARCMRCHFVVHQ